MVLACLHEGAPAPRRVSPRPLAPRPPNHVSVHPPAPRTSCPACRIVIIARPDQSSSVPRRTSPTSQSPSRSKERRTDPPAEAPATGTLPGDSALLVEMNVPLFSKFSFDRSSSGATLFIVVQAIRSEHEWQMPSGGQSVPVRMVSPVAPMATGCSLTSKPKPGDPFRRIL